MGFQNAFPTNLQGEQGEKLKLQRSSTALPQNVENQHPPAQVPQRGEPCKGETTVMRRFGISENSGL